MSTLADANIAMRERVTHLERRFGRKRVYLVGSGIALLLIVFFFRVFAFRHNEPPPPPVRPVLVRR